MYINDKFQSTEPIMVSKYVFYCRKKRKRQDYFQSSKIERKALSNKLKSH
jgi:hypothetical protein